MQISARLSNFWDGVKAISFGCCEYNELARLNKETYKSSGNVTPKIAVRLVPFRFPERAMPFRSLYYLAPAPKLLRRIADTFHALQICLDYPNVSIDASQINDSFIHNFENLYSFQTEICISSVCNFCKLLRIIEIIFNNTTAIILQAENLLTKVSDLSVENLHACVAKSMKLRTSGIDQCDSLERLDYRALIKATSDKLKEGSRREL